MIYLFELAYMIKDFSQNNKTILLFTILLICAGIGIFFIIDFNIWNKTGHSLWNKGSKQNKRK